MSIFTIGYEGMNIDAFVMLLRQKGVETIVDVREYPLSRKAGFSKNILRNTLEQHGIGYLHVRELGCPKPIREQYRADADWDRYTEGFLQYLAEQEPVVVELSGMAETTTCALLCFEADYNYCHRSMVAEAMHGITGRPVQHLQAHPVKKAQSAPHPSRTA